MYIVDVIWPRVFSTVLYIMYYLPTVDPNLDGNAGEGWSIATLLPRMSMTWNWSAHFFSPSCYTIANDPSTKELDAF